jgi:hypothetical protein
MSCRHCRRWRRHALKSTQATTLAMKRSYFSYGIALDPTKSSHRETRPNGVQFGVNLVDIGFQDADPATDFRGAGHLGLINLLEYSRTTKGQGCFRTAMEPSTQFFFCSAGLFITLLCSNLVRERKVDQLFVGNGNPESAFQQLYNNTFNRFHNFFNGLRDKSMMSFNSNLKQFERELRQLTE